jgi:DNA-binding NarL/FixJ family response regulator
MTPAAGTDQRRPGGFGAQPYGRNAGMKKKTVVIAEDHTILREGLSTLLEANDLDVVAEAEDGLMAIRKVEQHQPDLLLLDLSMPKMNGIAAIKDIKSRFPDTRILVLTVHKSEEYILETFRSGADGYCLKYANYDELQTAIQNVLTGKTYLSPDISEKVLEGYLEGRRELKNQSAWESLTQREKEILKLIGEGYTNNEIADYLCISVKTVDKHRANLMKKLDIHNAAKLTAFAIEKGLVST